MFILGAIVGALLGIIFTSLAVQEEQRNSKVLEKRSSILKKYLDEANSKIKNRDKLFEKLQLKLMEAEAENIKLKNELVQASKQN